MDPGRARGHHQSGADQGRVRQGDQGVQGSQGHRQDEHLLEAERGSYNAPEVDGGVRSRPLRNFGGSGLIGKLGRPCIVGRNPGISFHDKEVSWWKSTNMLYQLKIHRRAAEDSGMLGQATRLPIQITSSAWPGLIPVILWFCCRNQWHEKGALVLHSYRYPAKLLVGKFAEMEVLEA